MLKKIFKKTKIKFLSTKIVLILVFFLLATSVSANEGLRLHQFNKHIRQAREQRDFKEYQKASEMLQKVKATVSSTLLLKSIKKEEIKEIEGEIKKIKGFIEEKAKDTIPEFSLTSTPSSTSNSTPVSLQSKPLSSSPTPVPRTMPTGIDWEQFDRELNEKLKEVKHIDSNNSNESPKPTSETLESTISIEQQKAAKIISISDNFGNTHETNCWWSTTHYECPPKEQKEVMVSIGTTPELTFTINAQDPNNRRLTYHYYYAEGCRADGSNWITSNTCTSTLKTNQLGLRTFTFYVKNDDNYGSVGLDANTQLNYRILE